MLVLKQPKGTTYKGQADKQVQRVTDVIGLDAGNAAGRRTFYKLAKTIDSLEVFGDRRKRCPNLGQKIPVPVANVAQSPVVTRG